MTANMEVYRMNSVIKTENQINPVVQPQTSPTPIQISEINGKSILLDFDGGALSSDAGILLLKEVDQQIGLTKQLSNVIVDQRDQRYVQHPTEELMLQRIGQIAAGYEDANDCDELRGDPIFKLFVGRNPETDNDLGSQPTMSRFENAISRKDIYRIAYVFGEKFIESYEKEPNVIILDFDDTEDKVYGNQQLALFNGYFNDTCYMPLHVYEGLSGKLITTILKPGQRMTGKQTLAIIKRMIKKLREHWPNTIMVFRGDCHFTSPEVMEWIDDQHNVKFVSGLTSNAVLKRLTQSIVERAFCLYKHCQRKVVLFHSVRYKAKSWSKYRRVVIKVEISPKGQSVRFIVTDMEQAKAKALYQDIYCGRGTAELYIKEHKLYLKSDRTSCNRFEANQFRIFLHSAAYVLIHSLKTNIFKNTEWAKTTIETIRLRLFKIGARVRELKTRIKVELPTSYPLKETLIRSFQIFESLSKT
jgi:hypothetical protein